MASFIGPDRTLVVADSATGRALAADPVFDFCRLDFFAPAFLTPGFCPFLLAMTPSSLDVYGRIFRPQY